VKKTAERQIEAIAGHVDDHRLLNEEDVKLLVHVEKLKAEIKELEGLLKPVVKETVEHFGEITIEIGNYKVQLKKTIRNSASWKAIAYAVAPEEDILKVQPDFTLESVSYSAKVKEN